MKKNLLSLAVLAGLATGAANADEFYLIKDGKLQAGVELLEYADPADGTICKEDAIDGTDAYSIVPQVQYNDTRFYIAEGVDLAKYWNVEIEFYFPDGNVDVATHAGANKWAVMEMGYVDDTTGGKYGIDDAFYKQTYDVKFKSAPDTWNVEKQMIYALPTNASFKEFVFAWQRQINPAVAEIGPVYIKNLKFVGAGNRPFFAEDFNTLVAYQESFSEVQTYLIIDGEVMEDDYSANDNIYKYGHAGLPIYSAMNDDAGEEQGTVHIKRLYEDLGSDGSAFYDCDVMHALELVRVDNKKGTGRNGRTFYLVPTAGLEAATGFTLDYLCKWDASKATSEDFSEDTDPSLLGMKVYYAFVDDAVEASTCDMNPAFGADDLLAGEWTEYHAEFANVPGKKYIAVIFDAPIEFSYMIDNIRLACSGEGAGLSLTGVKTEAHPVGVVAYEMGDSQGAVENIINNADAVVSPVPATDVVTVSNEGVVKVEVVNAAGAVVASANDNQVNVSALANGIYVIKAYTAEGVLVAKIIKK